MNTIAYLSIFAYLIVLATCKVNYGDIQSELSKNINIWKNNKITSYDATIERTCYCPKEYLGPFNIKVKGNEIVDCDSTKEYCEGLPTVMILFGEIQTAINKEYAVINVKYDEKLGYPTETYFDISKMMADEEKGYKYKINDFKTDGKSICHLPMEVGMCKAAFLRYYYDKNSNTCKEFTYGGCQGNGNNFKTIKDCEKACKKEHEIDICKLPSETGPCRALMKRYFFNKKSGKCEEFIYGGCQGNGNNFKTIKDCEKACGNDNSDQGCFCIALHDPVCGSDGKTYSNSCHAGCAKVDVVSKGDCSLLNDDDDKDTTVCKKNACFSDPCEHATCPKYPHAKCKSNYCGGCYADFYIGNKKIDCGTENEKPNDSHCKAEGEKCEWGINKNVFGRHDYFFENNFDTTCCEGLTCCQKDCNYRSNVKTCQSHCHC